MNAIQFVHRLELRPFPDSGRARFTKINETFTRLAVVHIRYIQECFYHCQKTA